MKTLQSTHRTHLLFTVAPLLAVAAGGVVFHEFVMHAVRTNVALNGLILSTALIGAILMVTRLRAIKREWLTFADFEADAAPTAASQKRAQRSVAGRLLTHVGRIRQAGRAGPTEHAQVHEELEDVHRILESRQEVAQYIVGLMIALGLLGTFIGLLETLIAVGHLIGGFSSTDAGQDMDQALTKLIGNLQYPLTAMGTAFSASMFGLLGSLMLGLMMLAVRSFQVEFLQYARTVVDHAMAHEPAAADRLEATDDVAVWPHRALELQRLQLSLHDEVRELAAHAQGSEARLQRTGAAVAQMLAFMERREVQTQEIVGALSTLPQLLDQTGDARRALDHWSQQLLQAQQQAEQQRQAQTHQLVQQMLDIATQMERSHAEQAAAQHLALSALLEQRLASIESRHGGESAQWRQGLLERQQASEQLSAAAANAHAALLAGVQELKAASEAQTKVVRELLGATRSAMAATAAREAAAPTDETAAGDRVGREVAQAVERLEREVRIGLAALLDVQRQAVRGSPEAAPAVVPTPAEVR